MAVEIGWRQGSAGSDEVWVMDHGQWVCWRPRARGRAFGTPAFWTDYRPAIAAVVRYLKENA